MPYFGETNKNYLISSAVAGFFASFISLPFDNMKTRIQKMKKGTDGKLPYSSLLDWFAKTIRR